MARKVEVEQRELDALRAIANAARHMMGMSEGVRSGEHKFWAELRKRHDAREGLKLALADYDSAKGQ